MNCFSTIINKDHKANHCHSQKNSVFFSFFKDEPVYEDCRNWRRNLQSLSLRRSLKGKIVKYLGTLEAAQWFQTQIHIPKWITGTEGLGKKLFWLDTVMHHYCENNEIKSNISRDSHIPGNNKKLFNKNYSFQQSVCNRHPTAALFIMLLKRMIYIL